MNSLPWVVVVWLLVAMKTETVQGKPNIIYILSDDIGWGDHEANNKYFATPNLIKMAQHGVVLNQSYTLQTCTPTRSALLTGRLVV